MTFFRSFCALFAFFSLCCRLAAQPVIDCEAVSPKLENWQLRLTKINTINPDLIPLHYFFVSDMEQEMAEFAQNVLPHISSQCAQLSYFQIVTQFYDLSFRVKNVKDTLTRQKRRVDTLYFWLAEEELRQENADEARFFATRALQYNRLNTDALILKARLDLENDDFSACIAAVHILYNEAPLTRDHEMAVSDYTLALYDKLFHAGDSLLQHGRDAEALEMFKTLEHFCKNMPSNYCNDDYYKGIMRSKTGVYNSYLKIAEVAKLRNNQEIADIFLGYAAQYRTENPDEIYDDFVPSTILQLPDNQQVTIDGGEKQEAISEVHAAEEMSCEQLIKRGFEQTLQGEFCQALATFTAVKEKPRCDCFPLEDIVQMLRERCDNTTR